MKMSDFFTHETEKEKYNHNILDCTPPLAQETNEEEKMTTVIEPPRIALTLSNTLVQFLSPLQLQGYTARVIESCGTQHMDELAAQVTCEDDVEKLLGTQASLQQRRELWKGICKWKRLAGKHGREQTKKNNNKNNKKVSQCGSSSETILLSKTVITDTKTTRRFGDIDGHTASQFMRQFAFHGYKNTNGSIEIQSSPQRCSSEPVVSSVTNATTPSRNEHVINGIQEGILNSITPHRSSSWSSSTNTLFGSSYKDSINHCHRECVTLASLSVGANVDITGENHFADKWGIPSEEVVLQHLSNSSIVTPETEKNVYEMELVDKWKEEYEELQKNMRISLDKSLSDYNKGLQALQEKIHFALEKIPEDQNCPKNTMTRELALKLTQEPKLSIELHPAKMNETINVIVNVSTVPVLTSSVPKPALDDGYQEVVKITNTLPTDNIENLPCPEPRDSEAIRNSIRPSSLLNTTVISPLSGNIGEDAVLLSTTEVPSLSDITASERGSRRNTEIQISEEYRKEMEIILQKEQNMISQPKENNSSYDSLLHRMSERLIRLSRPLTSSYHTDEHIVEPPGAGEVYSSVNDNNDNDDDNNINDINNDELIEYSEAATPPLCNDEDNGDNDTIGAQIITSPFGMLSFEDFGLRALRQEVSKESVPLYSNNLLGDDDMHSMSYNENTRSGVETQVIDVDEISSCEDVEDVRIPNLYEEDSGTIPLHEQSFNLGLDNNFVLDNNNNNNDSTTSSSQDDDDDNIGVYTQLSQNRQFAVSRSPSLPMPLGSGEDTVEGTTFSLTDCATQLDWTSASSMVADVRNMISRFQHDEIENDKTVNVEKNLNNTNNTTVVISPQRSMAPQGLPPLPVKNPTSSILSNGNKTIKGSLTELTPDKVMTMKYKELKRWCKNLGLQISRDGVCGNDDEKKRHQSYQNASSMNLSECEDSRGFKSTQEENSNGWWLLNGGVGDNVSVVSSGFSEDQDDSDDDTDSDDNNNNDNNNYYSYYNNGINENENVSIHDTEGGKNLVYTSQSRNLTNDNNMACTPPTGLVPPLSTSSQVIDVDDLEWKSLQRASQVEKMRESLRLFIARRTFMQQVAPSFLQRLPRFSDGRPYKRVRAADLVKTQFALTQQQLEEQRRLARVEEQEEMVRCVIASLVGESVESIEQQSLCTMKGKINKNINQSDILSTSIRGGSPTVLANTGPPKLAIYEQILLMEPTDLQAATTLVQGDFPHVSRHRVETLLEESGIPLDTLRPVLNSEVGDVAGETGATQRSASSYSPPPTPTEKQKRQKMELSQQSKKRFFAQRGWLRRERGR